VAEYVQAKEVQTSDIVIMIVGACAVVMLLGGFVLLYKGTITLKDSNPEEAVKVEFKHLINVTTRYPALGLFVIGLAFGCVAIYAALRDPYHEFRISGKVEADDPTKATVVISFPVYTINPGDKSGTFHGTVPASRLDNISCRVILPGENSNTWNKEKTEIRSGTLDLGSLSLAGPQTQEKRQGEITTAPPLPPLDQRGNK